MRFRDMRALGIDTKPPKEHRARLREQAELSHWALMEFPPGVLTINRPREIPSDAKVIFL